MIEDPALKDYVPPAPPTEPLEEEDIEAFAETFRPAVPTDLLNPSAYTTRDVRDARYDICKGCDRLTKVTKQCKECNCVMPFKTWLGNASCDLGKWGAVS